MFTFLFRKNYAQRAEAVVAEIDSIRSGMSTELEVLAKRRGDVQKMNDSFSSLLRLRS